MARQVIAEFKDLDPSDATIDEIFQQAFDTFELAQRRLDRLERLRRGVEVSTPTPAIAERDARGLVTQGEGSHEVRVHRGWMHQIFPCILILLRQAAQKTTAVQVTYFFCDGRPRRQPLSKLLIFSVMGGPEDDHCPTYLFWDGWPPRHHCQIILYKGLSPLLPLPPTLHRKWAEAGVPNSTLRRMCRLRDK